MRPGASGAGRPPVPRRFPARVVVLALGVALAPGPVAGQADPAAGISEDAVAAPVAVLERYRAALFARDWAGAAAFVHPDDLGAFRTLVESLDSHPEGPELVAEWFGAADRLPTLDDTEVMGGYLRWLFAGQPGALELIRSAEWTVDEVTVSDDGAVVEATVAIPTDGDPLIVPDVTALRRCGEAWCIDLSAAIQALRESFEAGGGGGGSAPWTLPSQAAPGNGIP